MRNSLIPTFLIGLLATSTWASDDHSGHGDHGSMKHGEMEHGQMEHGEMDHGTMKDGEMDHSMMKDGVHTEVTVNSISEGTVNVSHGPIPEIGWPAMTMDLNLLDGAEVGDVEAGDDAMMILEKGDDGMFAIRAITPME